MSTPAQTDLAECAAYHELAAKVAAETRTYLARRAFPTVRIEEDIAMHARYAGACLEADGDEPRVTESKLERRSPFVLNMRYTHTFATLEIAITSYADIRARLVALGEEVSSEYIQEHDGMELIVFGAVALKTDLKPPLKELEGSYPVVLFVNSREEAEQLEREVKAAKPGMITRQL